MASELISKVDQLTIFTGEGGSWGDSWTIWGEAQSSAAENTFQIWKLWKWWKILLNLKIVKMAENMFIFENRQWQSFHGDDIVVVVEGGKKLEWKKKT